MDIVSASLSNKAPRAQQANLRPASQKYFMTNDHRSEHDKVYTVSQK